MVTDLAEGLCIVVVTAPQRRRPSHLAKSISTQRFHKSRPKLLRATQAAASYCVVTYQLKAALLVGMLVQLDAWKVTPTTKAAIKLHWHVEVFAACCFAVAAVHGSRRSLVCWPKGGLHLFCLYGHIKRVSRADSIPAGWGCCCCELGGLGAWQRGLHAPLNHMRFAVQALLPSPHAIPTGALIAVRGQWLLLEGCTIPPPKARQTSQTCVQSCGCWPCPRSCQAGS